MDFAQWIRTERTKRGWTQEKLASEIGTSIEITTIRRWEHGEHIPSITNLGYLKKAFGLDEIPAGLLEQLENDDHEPTSPQQWAVPLRNSFFTGRESIFPRISAALESGKATALTQAIIGLGGIGKTQIALEYVYRAGDAYDAVFWVRAESQEMLLAEYTALARHLRVIARDETDPLTIVRAVQRWLSDRRRWLLIFDNVEDFPALRAFLPAAPHGHILLTTRAQDIGALAIALDIEKMPAEEGALLLLRRASLIAPNALLESASTATIALAMHIASVMDGLPLALVQAGAYLRATGCDMTTYLERYHTRRAELLRQPDELNADYPASVATTWSLSFEKVAQQSPAAADLLRFCAFFDAEAIPEELILRHTNVTGSVLQSAKDEVALDMVIAVLRKYSFLQRTPQDKTLTIHRLVQAVQIDAMDQRSQQFWATRAVRAVNDSFPYVDASNIQPARRFILHAQACCTWIKKWHLRVPEAAQLLHKTGRYLREVSLYAQAEPPLQDALHLYETLAGTSPIEQSRCAGELAAIDEARGKFAEAEMLYQRSWTICEHLYGSEHVETAGTLNNLGLYYHKRGKYSQAEPLITQALAVRTRLLHADDPQISNSLMCLAEISSVRGKTREAEVLYRQALDMRERTLGTEDPLIATALDNLALCLLEQGRPDQAEPLCRRALAIYEQHFGAEHHLVAYALRTVAAVHQAQGKHAEAEALYHRVLAIQEHTLTPDHPEVAATLKRLALLRKQEGNLPEAETLLRRTLAMLEKMANPEHPHLIDTIALLALITLEQGKEEEAEQFTDRLLALAAQLRGLEHLRVANNLLHIGSFSVVGKHYARAEELYQRLLTTLEQVLGVDHPTTVILHYNLARVAEDQGKMWQADMLYFQTLLGIKQKIGYGHPSALPMVKQYHAFLINMQRFEEAALLEQIITLITQASAEQ